MLGDGLRDAMDPRTSLRVPDTERRKAEMLAETPNSTVPTGDIAAIDGNGGPSVEDHLERGDDA
ncbi:hypothetical protein ACFQL7_06430 [Halocatena marina]|uniref:Uncharacterized protein n=2 Tax=Halocatena marina TaxID=2934937 RepID=A0ABD5YM58_9EURY